MDISQFATLNLQSITQERLNYSIEIENELETEKFNHIIQDLMEKITHYNYKVHNKKFITDYESLEKVHQEHRKKGDLRKIGLSLAAIKEIINERLNVALKYDNKEDIEKFQKLNMEFQYMDFENKYNQMIEFLNRDEFTAANSIFIKDHSNMNQYLLKLTEKNKTNSKLSELHKQAQNLTQMFNKLKLTIEKKITLLIEEGPSDQIILESIKSDITIPEIVSLSGTDEIPEFISYLDSLFEEWSSNEEKSVKSKKPTCII